MLIGRIVFRCVQSVSSHANRTQSGRNTDTPSKYDRYASNADKPYIKPEIFSTKTHFPRQRHVRRTCVPRTLCTSCTYATLTLLLLFIRSYTALALHVRLTHDRNTSSTRVFSTYFHDVMFSQRLKAQRMRTPS
jgi:hypothetical protein